MNLKEILPRKAILAISTMTLGMTMFISSPKSRTDFLKIDEVARNVVGTCDSTNMMTTREEWQHYQATNLGDFDYCSDLVVGYNLKFVQCSCVTPITQAWYEVSVNSRFWPFQIQPTDVTISIHPNNDWSLNVNLTEDRIQLVVQYSQVHLLIALLQKRIRQQKTCRCQKSKKRAS